jgi:hypothetical protein
VKKISAAVVLLFFCSCQYFEKQIPSEKELLNKKLKEINWDEVDEYPSIIECDSLTNTDLRKQCFFQTLTTSIQQKLTSDTALKMLYPTHDSITLKITVLPNSKIQFKPQFQKDSIAFDRLKIDSLLNSRLIDLPKINPAIKRGIPVKTQFFLPINLKVK